MLTYDEDYDHVNHERLRVGRDISKSDAKCRRSRPVKVENENVKWLLCEVNCTFEK